MNPVLEAVAGHARQRPAAPALRGDRGAVSYADLAGELERCARALRGRVLGMLLDNGPGWIVLDLAAQAAGLACVPLPGFFSDSQIAHVIASAGVDAIVTDQPARVERLLDARQLLCFSAFDVAGAPVRLYRISAPAAPSPPDAVKITFTSGTSGTPKGVCLAHDAIVGVADSLRAATAATDADRSLSLLPLSTLLENVAVYAALLAGACACVPSLRTLGAGVAAIDAAAVCRALSACRPSVLVLVPQILRALVAAVESGGWRPPDSLRFLAVGGAPCERTLLERAAALGLPVYEGYGLSEAASVVSLNVPGACRAGSVGRPLPHVRVRIAGDGEVLVAGTVFQGYVGKPANAGDYWPTGDLGRLDEDGYLYLSGRKSSVLVTAYGRNVSPEWVETELLADPAVAQAVVLGHGKPFLVALLYPAPGADAGALHRAVAETNRRLPEYARVRRFHILQRPFDYPGGELTVNGRPRRTVIEANFLSVLEPFYQEDMHAVL